MSTMMPSVTAAPIQTSVPSAVRILVGLNVTALLWVSVAMRWTELDYLPGINGDEAWYGVQVERILQGMPIPWRTPTGNFLNPFYLLPLLGVHCFLGPSGFALRCVAAFSGTLLLIANYWLCQKSLGRTTAWISTIVLAILPINIAYSRFGWDASQSVLATLLVVYCSLMAVEQNQRRWRWTIAGGVALAAAIVVHPTNVFAAVFPVAALMFRYKDPFVRSAAKRSSRSFIALLTASVTLSLLCLPTAFKYRLTASQEALAFLIQLGRLFSGATVYRYISGAVAADPPGTLPGFDSIDRSDVFAWLLVALAMYGLWRWRRRWTATDVVLCAATGLMVIGFYVVAGPHAIAPHFERYAMCLVGPIALVISRGAAWWLTLAHDRLHCGKLAAACISWLIVANSYANYFGHLHRTGGDSHAAFRTSATEPKADALAYVLQHRVDHGSQTIATQEWWNYWPLVYFASRQPEVSVVWFNELEPGEARRLHDLCRLWSVEFSESTAELESERLFQSQGTYQRKLLSDPLGRSILTILGPTENSSQKD
jgi:MYXO-CTERM domain-containing protein